jgi:hypothetical protein
VVRSLIILVACAAEIGFVLVFWRPYLLIRSRSIVVTDDRPFLVTLDDATARCCTCASSSPDEACLFPLQEVL